MSKRQAPGSNQQFYQKHRWKRVSKLFKMRNPLCEVCEDVKPTEVTDHAIPIEQGGAKWDERNYMSMCSYHHNLKRNLEARNWTAQGTGTPHGKIPTDRNEVIDKLRRSTRVKINVDGSRS